MFIFSILNVGIFTLKSGRINKGIVNLFYYKTAAV